MGMGDKITLVCSPTNGSNGGLKYLLKPSLSISIFSSKNEVFTCCYFIKLCYLKQKHVNDIEILFEVFNMDLS